MRETNKVLVKFGKLVRQKRKARGWTLENLAHEAFGNGDRKGHISKIENGLIKTLTNDLIQQLANALDFNPLERHEFFDQSKNNDLLANVTDFDVHHSELINAFQTHKSNTRGITRKCDALIIVNSDLPYAQDCEDALRTSSYSALLNLNIHINFLSIKVPPTEDGSVDESTVSTISEAICEWEPEFVFSIGTGASVHVKNTLSLDQKFANLKHIFLMVSNPIDAGLISSNDLIARNGNNCGIIFSLDTHERLKFLKTQMSINRLLVIADESYRVDRLGIYELEQFAQTFKIEFKIYSPAEFINNSAKKIGPEEYDILFGWTGAHRHMRTLARHSRLPIFGGGRVDVRNGATLALAEDERLFARQCVEKILLPNLANGIELHSIPIYKTEQIDRANQFQLFADANSLMKHKFSLPSYAQKKMILLK